MNQRLVIVCLAVLWTALTLPAATNTVSGTISSSTTWSNVVIVRGNVTVNSSATLTILPGTEIRMTNNVSLTAQSGADIVATGMPNARIIFRSVHTNTAWGNIAITGSGSTLALRHAEVSWGGITLASSASALIEDTYAHHATEPVNATSASGVVVRRSRFSDYHKTYFGSTPATVEDSLFENMNSIDANGIEFEGAPAGSAVRRCTIRNGLYSNSDGFDCNGCTGVILQDCIIHDFSDKGMSLGAVSSGAPTSKGIVVSNCLIYRVVNGVSLKDSGTASLFQSTIANATTGFNLYQKYSGMGSGRVTNGHNNLFFNNTTNVGIYNGGFFTNNYSCFGGSNWPGIGNVRTNPLFLNSLAGDYRLASNSPVRGLGLGGVNMGVSFPVGDPFSDTDADTLPDFYEYRNGLSPFTNDTGLDLDGDKMTNLQEFLAGTDPQSSTSRLAMAVLPVAGSSVVLRFAAISNRTYTVQCRDAFATNVAWQTFTNVAAAATNRTLTLTNNSALPARFYRIATP
jgi:hypothetical protein